MYSYYQLECERGTAATASALHADITTGSSPVVRTNLAYPPSVEKVTRPFK